MANVLADERAGIVEALEGILPAFAYLPERIVPPAAFVHPGGPYVTSGETFGEHVLNFEVWLVMPSGTNEKSTTDLDEKLVSVIKALQGEGFVINSVDEPFIYSVQNANYLSAIVHVSSGVRFNH